MLSKFATGILMAALVAPLLFVAAPRTAQAVWDLNYYWDVNSSNKYLWVGDSWCTWGNEENLVSAVQSMLVEGWRYADAGYSNDPSVQIDGAWGTMTRNAVKEFQGDHNLSQDGCVGPNTWHGFRYNGHLTYLGYDGNGGYHYEYDDGWWHNPSYAVNNLRFKWNGSYWQLWTLKEEASPFRSWGFYDRLCAGTNSICATL